MLEDLSPYADKRRQFFHDFFEKAHLFDAYVATGDPGQQKKWASFRETISLSDEQKAIVSAFKRRMNILVMSGIWCGDCSRQGPMIQAIADAAPDMEVRFIDNKSNPELLEELRLNGAEKVPIVVSLSEDFFEVGRFGDSHLSVYRKKAETQLGAACDAGILPPPANELAVELQEWVNYFERIFLTLRLAPMLRRRHGD